MVFNCRAFVGPVGEEVSFACRPVWAPLSLLIIMFLMLYYSLYILFLVRAPSAPLHAAGFRWVLPYREE